MSPGGDISEPASERQVRPIAGAHLPAPQQRTAWQAAHDMAGGPPTSEDVEAAVASILRIRDLSASEQVEAASQSEERIRRAGAGRAAPLDARAKLLELASRHAHRLRKTLEGLGGEADAVLSRLDEVDTELSALEGS